MQNLPCRSISLAGISSQIKAADVTCSKSWQPRPLSRDNALLRARFQDGRFQFWLEGSSLSPPWEGRSPSPRHLVSGRSIGMRDRIKRGPRNSLCGCVAHHPSGLRGTAAGEDRRLRPCSRAGDAPSLGFGSSSQLVWGLQVLLHTLVPSVGSTVERHHRLAGQ